MVFGLRLSGTDHNHLLALTVSNVKTRGRQRICSSLTVSAMHERNLSFRTWLAVGGQTTRMMIVRQGLGTRLHKRHNTVTHYHLIDVGEDGNS